MTHRRSWLNRLGLLWLLSLLAFSFMNQTSVAAQSATCGTSPTPQLTLKGFGRVTPGNSNNLRDSAAKSGNLIGTIPAGGIFEVLEGPTCNGGLNWWRVRYEDLEGWTVEGDAGEYWLVPYEPAFKTTLEDGTTHVNFDNFSFDILTVLAQDINYEFKTASWDTIDTLPDHVCFSLQLNPPDTKHRFNRLCVLDVKGFENYAASLDKVLTEKPTFAIPDSQIEIPTLIADAAQIIQSNLHYIDTDVLRGVSFVTRYAQNAYFITREDLEYNFSGLTRDGKHIVFIAYDVDTTLLPPNDYTDAERDALLNEVYKDRVGYYTGIVATLNKGTLADLTPNLNLLDAVVESMHWS